MPASEIESGELLALLETVSLPVTLPAAAGVNVALIVVVCPGFRITPEAPEALNPAPETVTFEMVMAALPAFVSVTFCELLAETFTLPKLRADVLEFRIRVEALTVSVAALLVALPALLETVTLNCAFEVSAGVVYEEDVAPLIATPLLLHW